jgi:lysophospholipase L1-like esterase
MLIDSIRAQSPQTRLFVQSLLPINETNGRWKTLAGRTDDIPFVNMFLRAYCQSKGITFIDLFSHMTRGRSNQLRADLTTDGLHINDQGYKIWAFQLRKYLRQLDR